MLLASYRGEDVTWRHGEMAVGGVADGGVNFSKHDTFFATHHAFSIRIRADDIN